MSLSRLRCWKSENKYIKFESVFNKLLEAIKHGHILLSEHNTITSLVNLDYFDIVAQSVQRIYVKWPSNIFTK